ncbi:MAG: hypothetical protein MUC88_01400 [Planctomycetes bacterium]|jgi:hypothetical protein|nr:hypothetical protein [Planctomycetota bacterium]
MVKVRWLILSLVACCGTAAPALAHLAVVVDASQTKMTIQNKASAYNLEGLVEALNVNSDLTVQIQDTDTHAALDGVKLDNYDMDLLFHYVGSGNNYTANGTFELEDNSGSSKMKANFTSTSVSLTTLGGQLQLMMDGVLSTFSGDSILLGGAPWVFTGDSNFSGADADGNAQTVTIDDPSDHDVGGLVAIHYPVYGKYSTLEQLFTALANGSTLGNGSVHAQVVPVPAALLLGVLGVGVTGLKLRKYA